MTSDIETLCAEAIDRGASTIHLDPGRDGHAVRLRIDGGLVPLATVLPAAAVAFVGSATDGDFAPPVVDCAGARWRVSAIPVMGGLHVCLHRVLDGTPTWIELGLTPTQAERLESALTAQAGLVLLTSPPRSGKTSTFYAALSWLDPARRRVVTIEDPIERTVAGALQRARPAHFTDPADIARSLAAQDPDVIGIGEIVDPSIAALVFDCASSGMRVLATFRSADATSALGRLFQLAIEPFQLVSALHTVVAQRLLPLSCTHCLAPDPAGATRLAALGLAARSIEPRAGAGCDHCRGTGTRGRIGVFEVLEITPSVQQHVLEGATRGELALEASKSGMVTLRQRALELVGEGRVRVDDALRATDG